MIETIKSIIDIIMIFINSLFNLQIDFFNDQKVAIGVIVIAFVVFILVIYLVASAIGLIKND